MTAILTKKVAIRRARLRKKEGRSSRSFSGTRKGRVTFTANIKQNYANGVAENKSFEIMQVFGLNNGSKVNDVEYKTLPNVYDTYFSEAQPIIDSFSYT